MIKIPTLLLIMLGYGGDILRMLGIHTSVSSVNMKILCIQNYYSNKKSVRDLGVVYQSVDNAIADAVSYFRGESLPINPEINRSFRKREA
jgi:hypothetical protein